MNSTALGRLKNLKSNGTQLADFGLQPVSNRFLQPHASQGAPSFPFSLRIDPRHGLVHMGEPFPVSELCPRYSWLTCFEPEAHLDGLVERLIALPSINRDSVFGAYSFKDDTTLERLKKLGYANTWRIDPAEDLKVTNPMANVETWQQFFTPERAGEIRDKEGAVDVFIVRHVLEHSYDLEAFLVACQTMVRPGGYVIFEVPDCARAFELGDCTTLWEEHVFYFTPQTLRGVLRDAGFKIFHFESYPYPFENSLIAITGVGSDEAAETTSADEEIARAQRFASNFKLKREAVRDKLVKTRETHGPIAIFGAGHLSVAFLSLFGISDLIDFVIDDNPNKTGLRMPCGDLPILGSAELYHRNIRVCLLSLNPQNQPKVIQKHAEFIARGGKFASIFPGSDLEMETLL